MNKNVLCPVFVFHTHCIARQLVEVKRLGLHDTDDLLRQLIAENDRALSGRDIRYLVPFRPEPEPEPDRKKMAGYPANRNRNRISGTSLGKIDMLQTMKNDDRFKTRLWYFGIVAKSNAGSRCQYYCFKHQPTNTRPLTQTHIGHRLRKYIYIPVTGTSK